MSDYEAGQERGYADGRASRDAEVAALEARVVELEAVVQAAKEWNTLTNGRPRYRDFDELISKAPSVVLADHDAAVWDQGLSAAIESGYRARNGMIPNPYRGDTNA